MLLSDLHFISNLPLHNHHHHLGNYQTATTISHLDAKQHSIFSQTSYQIHKNRKCQATAAQSFPQSNASKRVSEMLVTTTITSSFIAQSAIASEINCCSHYFCFACIMEWAKHESRCPICCQRFSNIRRPPKHNVFYFSLDVKVPFSLSCLLQRLFRLWCRCSPMIPSLSETPSCPLSRTLSFCDSLSARSLFVIPFDQRSNSAGQRLQRHGVVAPSDGFFLTKKTF